jgi:hypothetical protein
VSIPKDLHEFVLQPSVWNEDEDFTRQASHKSRNYTFQT